MFSGWVTLGNVRRVDQKSILGLIIARDAAIISATVAAPESRLPNLSFNASISNVIITAN